MTSGLAAGAGVLGVCGPMAARSLALDCALALAGAALMLWRVGVGLSRRLAAAPAEAGRTMLSVLDLEDAERGLVDAVACAPDLTAALHLAADRLRGECGARHSRVYEVENSLALRELFTQHPGFRAAPRELGGDLSAAARCVRSAQLCIDLPAGAALPVLKDGAVVAVLELEAIDMGFEGGALAKLLGTVASALSAATAGAPMQGGATLPGAERRRSAAALASSEAASGLEAGSTCPC